MSGVFSFVAGLFSLGAADGMESKSRTQAEREYQEKIEKAIIIQLKWIMTMA